MSGFLNKKGVQYFIGGLIVIGLLLVFLNPQISETQHGGDFAVHLTLIYLFGGLFFLIFNVRNVMLMSLSACVILCLFLKGASNSSFLLPDINSEPKLTVAHISTSNAGPHDNFMTSVLDLNADVVSIQEVEPGWEDIIEYYLQGKYPYKHKNIRIDDYGMALYSKYPIIRKDTLVTEEFPSLYATVYVENKKAVSIISTYVYPSFDNRYREMAKSQLYGLAQEIEESKTPVINLGDFNYNYWDITIRDYREECGLENSRRDDLRLNGTGSTDHIFYTKELECTNFEVVLDRQKLRHGILGTYQFKEKKKETPSAITSKINRF